MALAVPVRGAGGGHTPSPPWRHEPARPQAQQRSSARPSVPSLAPRLELKGPVRVSANQAQRCVCAQVQNGFASWWESQPPITKWLATLMVGCSALTALGLLKMWWFAFIPQLVFRKFEVRPALATHPQRKPAAGSAPEDGRSTQAGVTAGRMSAEQTPRPYCTSLVAPSQPRPDAQQRVHPCCSHVQVWRLVTNFFFFKLGINFVIRLIWVIQYGGQLESQTYQFEPADYLFMLIFNGILCLISAPITDMPLLGMCLISSIIYVWSKHFPDNSIMLYGLVKIQSFYLPFAFLAISLLLSQSMIPDIVGIVVGHIYYYLHDIYPRVSGRQILQTPGFLKRWLADAGLRGAAPPPSQTQGAPQGFRAFGGRGRRLAD